MADQPASFMPRLARRDPVDRVPQAVDGEPGRFLVDALAESDGPLPIVLFCNGPQCTATPQAVAALMEAGWAPDRLRYYRGGMHDRATLGLPVSVAAS